MRREERPDAVIVHCQGIRAATGGQRPHFDCLVGRCGHDGITVIAYQYVSNIVCVTHELSDALPGLGVPDSNNTFRSSTCENGTFSAQSIDRTFSDTLIFSDID